MYVRIMLEIRDYNANKIDNIYELKQKFIDFCTQIETKYSNIKFYGGKNMNDWKTIYEFKNKHDIKEVSLYS